MPVQNDLLSPHHQLTPSLREAMELVADGCSDEEIAANLGITLRAVESRIHKFCDRSGLRGRRVVVWAVGHRACCIENDQVV